MNLDHDKEAFAELIAGAAESSVPGLRRCHYGTAFCPGEL